MLELKQWVEGPDALGSDEEKDALALTLASYEGAKGRKGAALAAVRSPLPDPFLDSG